MFSFFKRKNTKKNANTNDPKSNVNTSTQERDGKISMVQSNQEKSKSADHNIQQVPKNKCSQNIDPSRIKDRVQKTSPLDGIIEDKNKTTDGGHGIQQSLHTCYNENGETNSSKASLKSVENGEKILCKKNVDIDQEIECNFKNKQKDDLHEIGGKRINGIQTLSHGDGVKLFRDHYPNNDVKGGKEVINLLLPEKSYKKTESISKTAVQNLFDIMGGGKKRKNKSNKYKTPEITNRKSWSFNNKFKSDSVDNDDEKNKSFLEHNIQREKIALQRSASVPSANICPNLISPSTHQTSVNSLESVENAECNKIVQRLSMPIDEDANKPLESSSTKIIESTSANNSTCHNKNKRQTPIETPAIQCGDKTQSGLERGSSDDLRSNVTSDLIGNCAKTVGSLPEHCEESVHFNSTSSKCDTGQTCHDDSACFIKALLLDKYKNNKIQNTDHKLENDSSLPPLKEDLETRGSNTKDNFKLSSNKQQSCIEIKNTVDNNKVPSDMGATDSRHSSGRESGNKVDKSFMKDENTTGNYAYVVSECGRAQGEAVNVTQGEKTVVITSQIDVNVLNENNLQNNITSSSPDISEKVKEDSLLERCETEMELIDNASENEGNRLKNILKEAADFEAKAAVKKHVTFHKIIHFDDGDNVEDDDSVSFASLDDEDDENIKFDLNKVDNYEVVFPENDESSNHKSGNSKTNDDCLIGNGNRKENDSLHKHLFTRDDDVLLKFKNQDSKTVEIQELCDDVENNENLGLEDSEETVTENECSTNEEFNKIIEVKEMSESEEEETDEEEETCEENSEDESESADSSSVSDDLKKEKVIFDSDKVAEELKKQEAVWDVEDKDDSAYAELLRVVERQLMRGLAGQEGRLADLQERAAALHRVQSEVCSARKEAELIRQKLRHVEGDLAATRSRNSQLLEQLEARAEEVRLAERKADELAEEVVRLQQKLDQIQPDYNELKGITDKIKKEREAEKKANQNALVEERALRDERERSWKAEFEKLRSQSAENEELLLADCEWKLRDVQKSASARCAMAEGKLVELQKTTDEKCEQADKQITELRIEISSLRANSVEQQRALRQSTQHAGTLEAAKNALEQESKRLKTLLNMEMDKTETIKAQHARELDEKERRMMIRLAEEAKKAELQGRMTRRIEECSQHEKALREANKRIQDLKDTLAKKESQFSESLEKAEARADWKILEIRRSLDKAELKYSEGLEKLQDQFESDTERITTESEKRIKELENVLSAQTCSSRTTLELVRDRLLAEHSDNMQKLKEQHRMDMESQWDLFTRDKEQCLERMKTECIMEGEEEREKRDKQLLQDIDELKQELGVREKDVGALRLETKKANEARASAERKLSEAQAACVAREIAVRSEAARMAEVERKEAKDTIDHLTKKCACLSNLFEDMRSRWQQAPGEAAQLRKALQDEKARAQALRRQLDALSRDLGVTVQTGENENNQVMEGDASSQEQDKGVCVGGKKISIEKNARLNTVTKRNNQRSECELEKKIKNECDDKSDTAINHKCDVKNIRNTGNSKYNTQNINQTKQSQNELGDMWTLVKAGLRKRGRRAIVSPPRKTVELPAVTVPLRIKQFDANRKK